MTQAAAPVDPDPRFLEFLEKSQAIAGEKVAAAIPREYMQPSVARGFAGFAVSLALYVAAIVGMAVLDRWYLVPPLVVGAGLGGWGLHCIGHDCGHGSFSRNRRLNFAIGHLSLLPLLYPFHAWRHVHNWHHAHTNSLELDTDWRPISEAVYRRMPLRHRILYASMRTWAVWAGSINYWAESGFGLRISRRGRCAGTCAGQSRSWSSPVAPTLRRSRTSRGGRACCSTSSHPGLPSTRGSASPP